MEVLLVEDNEMMLKRIAALLESHGHSVVGCATTEAQAVELIEQLRPQAVVADISLSEGSGIGLLRRLQGRLFRPLIVVVTNNTSVEYKTQAMALGAACFLDKSFQLTQLPGVLNRLSGRRHADDTQEEEAVAGPRRPTSRTPSSHREK